MLNIYFASTQILCLDNNNKGTYIKNIVCRTTGLDKQDFYLLQNGKLIHNNDTTQYGSVHIIPRLVGGKGGFGSMLRAIGAQIEKTTNREACRDLSGRRLRDINEEKRLKTWIAQQVEREKDALIRKQKKLEKLCEEPKCEFKDDSYDKEGSDLAEKVEDAVLQGLKASSSQQTVQKRKRPEQNVNNIKKPKLWVDADIEFSSSESDDSGSESIMDNSIEIIQSSCSIEEKSDPTL